MGFLKVFSGKDPQEFEKKGDHLFEAEAFGDAKLQYEAGLHKLGKKDPANSILKNRFQGKILSCKEALALQHKQRGEEIMASQYYEDAEEVFRLALELTENPELTAELHKQLQKIQVHFTEDETPASRDFQHENTSEEISHIQEDEYFSALCGSFSDKEREKAYKNYGDAFREGYLALNQGNFRLAATQLSQSMSEYSMSKSYIPLELATAYLNLEKNEKARDLLLLFLKDYPESLEGYSLLCETFWEMKLFDQAHELLQTCPENLSESPQIQLLRGETLFQAKKFQEAKELFSDFLKNSSWNENIALSLAKTYEALGEKEKALNLYGTVMDRCSSCGSGTPSFIKQKYADISMECGQFSTKVLELYLSLAQEDPDHRRHHYRKIIEIYTALGNEKEAQRFQSMALSVHP